MEPVFVKAEGGSFGHFSMVEKHILGIYWGLDAFSIVLTTKFQPAKLVHIPFNTPVGTDQTEEIPETLKYKALIEQALAKNGVSVKTANLCLPTKDTIFRSFIIPMMRPSEVASVVDFEARKYIPIPLEQLSYTFHSVPAMENQQRKLRVLFVATRKTIITRYARILDQAGLQLQNIEPEPVCMIRVLQHHGLLQGPANNAIISIGRISGKVVIAANGIVEFVREFPVSANEEDPHEWQNKVLNDIRVSLSFFGRQFPDTKINKIVGYCIRELPSLSKTLSEEFAVPVSIVSPADLLQAGTIPDLGLLNAYGSALRGQSFSPGNFDLSKKAILRLRQGPSALESMDYKKLAVTALTCIAIIVSTLFLGNKVLNQKENRLAELQSQQGRYSALTQSEIAQQEQEIAEKLSSYQTVRLNSNMTFYLVQIPHLLPKGAWLSSLDMTYKEISQGRNDKPKTSFAMVLNGYAYHPDLNKQFNIVDDLLGRLREAETLSEVVKNFELTTQQATLGDHSVKSFTIRAE